MTQQNGFGRRGTVRRDLPRPASSPAAPPTGPRSEFARQATSRGARQIGGVLIGVTLVAGIVGLYVTGMKSVGRALDRQWEENAGYPQLDNPPKRMTAQMPVDNKVREACRERAKHVQLSRAMRTELDYFVNIRVGEQQLEQHATFLDGLMTETPARFCRADHKAHLVQSLRDYFRLRMRVREEWMMSRSPFGAASVGLVARPGSQGITTRFPSERTDPRIISGLTALIQNGYLTRGDLGAGMFSRAPGDLNETLKNVERKKKACG